jgi:hypothetical protein
MAFSYSLRLGVLSETGVRFVRRCGWMRAHAKSQRRKGEQTRVIGDRRTVVWFSCILRVLASLAKRA